MKKLFTLLALMCMVCTGAWATVTYTAVTDLSTLSADKYYQIKHSTRGTLVVADGKSNLLLQGATVSGSSADCMTAVVLDKSLWRITPVDGGYTIQSNANSKYVGTSRNLADAETTLSIVSTGSGNTIYIKNGSNFLCFWPGYSWSATSGGPVAYKDSADGSDFTIYEVNANIDDVQNTINEVLPKAGKVGYPSDMTALLPYQGSNVNWSNFASAETALNTVLTSTSVVLPTDGKAYYIKAKFQDGSYKYIVNGEGNLLAHSDAASTMWVAKKMTNGTFVLVGEEDAKYFYIEADGKTKADMDKTAYNATKGALTISKHAPTHGQSYASATAADLFGCLTIKGQNTYNTESFPLLAGSDGKFRNGGANDYYYDYTISGNIYRSCQFIFEEYTGTVGSETVSNPNQIKLSSPNNGGTGSLDGKCIGTFSAPYAVELPENVTAYTADYDADRNVVVFNELGTTVPANTGVLLYAGEGEFTVKEAAVPSTASVSLEGRDNCFRPTGANGITVEGDVNAYILSYKEGKGVKFYVLSDEDRTIARNKAYLDLTSANVSAFVFDFEDSTTGIQQIDTTRRSNTTYDLAGRNVKASQRGLYIIGGKKVIR